MFTLELDLTLIYDPSMDEDGGGICLTREIQLPFAPHKGLKVYSRQLDHAPGPDGFELQDVIWDIDREVFLGDVELTSCNLPIADIPADISSWVELGWRLGSYADQYEPEYEEADSTSPENRDASARYDWDLMQRHPSMSPRQRPKELNPVMQAMVRAMAEAHNNLPVAYVIDQTKRYFSQQQLKDADSSHTHRFREAIHEFNSMPWRERWAWRDRVVRRHPRLDKLIAKT